MAENNHTPEPSPWKPLDLSKHWEATPKSEKQPPPTDEQRALWAKQERQEKALEQQAQTERLKQMEQRPFMRLQVLRASGALAYADVLYNLSKLSATPPVEGAELRFFDGIAHGEPAQLQAWFIDVNSLAEFRELMRHCQHSVVLEDAAQSDLGYERHVSLDADFLMTVVDDWVEINE